LFLKKWQKLIAWPRDFGTLKRKAAVIFSTLAYLSTGHIFYGFVQVMHCKTNLGKPEPSSSHMGPERDSQQGAQTSNPDMKW
jgi:hypothetical protein